MNQFPNDAFVPHGFYNLVDFLEQGVVALTDGNGNPFGTQVVADRFDGQETMADRIHAEDLVGNDRINLFVHKLLQGLFIIEARNDFFCPQQTGFALICGTFRAANDLSLRIGDFFDGGPFSDKKV